MKQNLIPLLILLAGLFVVGNGHTHELTVKMRLFPASSFEAKSGKLKGEVKKDKNKYTAENLWIKIEDFKTEIALRDEHFHKHLNFEKYPKITFTKVVATSGKGKGTLTINDVKKVVLFTYKMTEAKKLEATFKVKASEFKLKEAKYMEIGVEDEVEVTAVIDV